MFELIANITEVNRRAEASQRTDVSGPRTDDAAHHNNNSTTIPVNNSYWGGDTGCWSITGNKTNVFLWGEGMEFKTKVSICHILGMIEVRI